MARQVLTTAQARAVEEVTKINRTLRREKTEAYAEARKAADEKVRQISAQQDQLIRAAVDLGVPLAEFRRKEQGLHTTDPGTVLKCLERTQSTLDLINEAVISGRQRPYRIDGDELVIETNREETDATVSTEQAYGYEVRFGRDEQGALTRLTPGKMPEQEEAWPGSTMMVQPTNPPIAWLNNHRDLEAEALQWWADNS